METVWEAWERHYKEVEKRAKELREDNNKFIAQFCKSILEHCGPTDCFNLAMGSFPAWVTIRIASDLKAVSLYYELTKALIKSAQVEYVLKYQK